MPQNLDRETLNRMGAASAGDQTAAEGPTWLRVRERDGAMERESVFDYI
jgi:hypothetical protein